MKIALKPTTGSVAQDSTPAKIADAVDRQYADAIRRNIEQIADRFASWYGEATMGRKRGDASASTFAYHLMTHIVAEFYLDELPEFKWVNGGLLAQDTSMPGTVKAFEWSEGGYHGDADVIDDDADDSPRADVNGRMNAGRARTIGCHFRLGRDEVDTAREQGSMMALATEKGNAARTMLDMRTNRIIGRGRAEFGWDAATLPKGAIVDAAATGSWLTNSGAVILEDLRTFHTALGEGLANIETLEPDTCLMPKAILTRLSATQFSVADNSSILDVLKKYFPTITRWDWTAEHATSSPAGGRALQLYRNDKRVLRAVMPRGVRFLPDQERGRAIIVNADRRYGGLIVKHPLSIGVLTGI